MKIKEIMSKGVFSVDVDDFVSSALGKMKKHQIHQLVIFDDDKYKGLLELKNVVVKDINPSKTKVETLMSRAPSIGEEDDVSEAVELLLNSGFRALPVVKNGKVEGIISETDIINSDLIDKDTTVGDVMSSCVYVSPEDKASTIKNIMMDTNVSRVPVVENGKVVGIVGTLEMIQVLEERGSLEHRGDTGKVKGATEKVGTEDVMAKALMSKPSIVRSDQKLRDVVDMLRQNEELVVSEAEVCIISPKDVLELIRPKKEKGVHVEITGLHDEPTEIVASLDRYSSEFVQNLGKSIEGIEFLFVHVEKMQKGGKRQKYSIRLRMRTPLGLFVAHRWGWEPLAVIQEVFNVLEREVRKKYEKIEERRRS